MSNNLSILVKSEPVNCSTRFHKMSLSFKYLSFYLFKYIFVESGPYRFRNTLKIVVRKNKSKEKITNKMFNNGPNKVKLV